MDNWNTSTLYYCPVLNFAQHNLDEELDHQSIMKYASDFFPYEDVLGAKKLLYSNCFPDEPIPRRSGSSAKNSSLSDIIATLSRCSAENIDIPEFVIKSPSEVPSIPASAYSILTAKVNQCLDQLKSLAHLNSPTTSINSSLVSDSKGTNHKPSYAVVLKYPPPELRDPVSRKEKLDSFAGHDGIVSVKSDPVRKRWVVVTRDKVSANSLAASAVASYPNILAKVIDRKPLGVIRGLPDSVSSSILISVIPGLVEASQIGSSHTFRLEFLDSAALKSAIATGLRLGYESFKISEYKELPRRCLRCQSIHHSLAHCPCAPNEMKCSKCSGCHSNTKDNPCLEAPKCANCGEAHVSYSMNCPVIKRALNSAPK